MARIRERMSPRPEAGVASSEVRTTSSSALSPRPAHTGRSPWKVQPEVRAVPSRLKAMTSAALLEGDAVVRTKAQIAPVTKLEMMFEEPRPYVEIPRLWPVRGDPGRDQNGFRLALAQVDALVARLAIVREPHEFIPAAERDAFFLKVFPTIDGDQDLVARYRYVRTLPMRALLLHDTKAIKTYRVNTTYCRKIQIA